MLFGSECYEAYDIEECQPPLPTGGIRWSYIVDVEAQNLYPTQTTACRVRVGCLQAKGQEQDKDSEAPNQTSMSLVLFEGFPGPSVGALT